MWSWSPDAAASVGWHEVMLKFISGKRFFHHFLVLPKLRTAIYFLFGAFDISIWMSPAPQGWEASSCFGVDLGLVSCADEAPKS